MPDSLQFSWQLLIEDTELDGATLVVDYVPAVITCRACGAETTLEMAIMLCPHCDCADVTLVSGEEFQITSIDRVHEVC